MIGLVFAPSRRQIEIHIARQIGREVGQVSKVGVFVNAPLVEVQEIARQCRLDCVQLHGDEDEEYCRALGIPVIKAVRANAELQMGAWSNHPAEWILLDTALQGQFGGAGKTFDWEHASRMRKSLTKPLMIAGGLSRENVLEAIALLQSEGVDVSGGVETAGIKDPVKIAEFIETVRRGR